MSKQREGKREQFVEPEQKRFGGKLAIIAVVVVLIGAGAYFLLAPGGGSALDRVQSQNGEVRLDLNQINDGQAHYFRFVGEKGDITFFVIKSVDGVMRAAFDACDVCYREKKGYRQEGDMMVCNNCDMKFRSDLINLVKGGCNPAPLSRRIDGSQLVIKSQDILQGAWYFGS